MMHFLAHNKKLVFSIALNVVLAIALFMLLRLFYPQFIYELESVTSVGRYNVRTYSTLRPSAYFEVLYGPEDHLRRPGMPRSIYSRCGEMGFHVESLGAHLTEKDVPYLVMWEWNGSASGYGSKYLVFKLDGPAVKEVAVLKGVCSLECEDLNGDGVDEIVARDEAYCFWGGYCRAGSPYPPVVLSLDESQGRFVLNKKLMAKPPLSDEEFRKLSVAYKNDFWWREMSAPPSDLFSTMFELIYSGNEKQAWELLDASWAEGSKRSKEEWKAEVLDGLKRSPLNPAAWPDAPTAAAPGGRSAARELQRSIDELRKSLCAAE